MKAIKKVKAKIRQIIPKPFILTYKFFNPKDIISITSFLIKSNTQISFRQRLTIIKKLYFITWFVDCSHTHIEIISFINTILSIPAHIDGCIVEAGCYKGGSTAKFSLAANLIKRELIVFDSFEGIPKNEEEHRINIFWRGRWFPQRELLRNI